MNNRKAFTLTELLVVIGIILVLVTLLVPIIAHVRRTADITTQKADFQVISSALEAYKQDFGDYPRNIRYPTWTADVEPTGTPTFEAPGSYALAAALIGPGPGAILQDPQSSTIEAGDGATGLGSRTQVDVFVTTLSNLATPASSTIQVTALPSSWANYTLASQLSQFQQLIAVTSVVLDYGNSNEETVAIAPPTSLPFNNLMLNLTTQTLYKHLPTAPVHFNTAIGKVWSNYLPPNRFQVTYVTYTILNPTSGINYYAVGQPILLDHWGNPIEYFPRWGPNTNRTKDSTYNTPFGVGSTPTTPPTDVIGPLYGYSTPQSAYNGSIPAPLNPYGMNAIWDQRDGGVRFTNTGGGLITAVPWQTVSMPAPFTSTDTPSSLYDPGIAFRWMLGDVDNNNLIDKGETLRFDGKYILISSGPSPIDATNGGFCNMTGLITNDQKSKAFLDSGNIYNFDR